jgi:hypothetical protein
MHGDTAPWLQQLRELKHYYQQSISDHYELQTFRKIGIARFGILPWYNDLW